MMRRVKIRFLPILNTRFSQQPIRCSTMRQEDVDRLHAPQISASGAVRHMPVLRQHSKHMAAAERHNRCVVDAGRFHYPVMNIAHLVPSCFHGTSASRGSFIGDQCRNLCRCLPKICDRWRAKRAERETKTSNRSLEGRRTT